MRLLEIPGAIKGRRSDKEAETEFPPSARALDIVQPSPCYQCKTKVLGFSKCTKPTCRMGMLRTPESFGKGRSRDKKATNEKLTRARTSNLLPKSPSR